jgi:uncharacterized protein (TIGR02001 family)
VYGAGRVIERGAYIPRRGKWFVVLQSLASLGHAQGLGGSMGVATDSVFRGLSENEGRISPQADLHAVLGAWFGGLSAEEVRRGIEQGAGAELIAYAGFQHRLGEDWSGRVTLRHYDYPGNALRTRYNYDELAVSAAWRERLIVTVVASPDTYFRDYVGNYGSDTAYCFELSGRQPLPLQLSAVAGVGYYDLQRQIGTGYAYWSAGLNRRWDAWGVDLRYVGTDATARHHFQDLAGDRAVLSVFWLF